MQKPLGALEAQLLAYAQLRQLEKFRVGELRLPLHLNTRQELRLLSQMARKKLLVRVTRGLYLVPPRLPLGGIWSPSEIAAIDVLMESRGGRYQICGPNAFNRYGFDNQMPVWTYLYNNRFSGERRIGSVYLQLIKVGDKRLGQTTKTRTREGRVAVYSSRVRTLVDAVYDWSRFDGIPRAYEWIRSELAAGRVEAVELARTTVRYGNQGTIRRMGVLLEQEGASKKALRLLEGAMTASRSPIAWIPRKPKRGRTSARWGVIIHEEA